MGYYTKRNSVYDNKKMDQLEWVECHLLCIYTDWWLSDGDQMEVCLTHFYLKGECGTLDESRILPWNINPKHMIHAINTNHRRKQWIG